MSEHLRLSPAVVRALMLAMAVTAVVLLVIAVFSPAMAMAAIPGVLVGSVGVLSFGRILPALAAVGAMAVLAATACSVSAHVWGAAVLMALVGLATALAGRVGLRGLAMNLGIFTAASLFPPPGLGGAAGSLSAALALGGSIAVGGLLGVLAFHFLGRGKTLPRPAATPWPEVIVNAAALVITMFFGTMWVLTWDRSPVAAWLMVTMLVLVHPSSAVTLRRSVERVLGTLLGALLAAGIIAILGAEWQRVVIAFVLLVLAWSFRLSNPVVEAGHYYWIYALLWTPAMVILAVPQGGSASLSADTQRVLLTVIAAVAVALVSTAVRMVVTRSVTIRPA